MIRRVIRRWILLRLSVCAAAVARGDVAPTTQPSVNLRINAAKPLRTMAGALDRCAVEGVDLEAGVVGGDVVRSDVLLISVTALGDLEGRLPVTRAGAHAGDVIAFAGRLGWAAAGLATLTRGFRSPRLVVDAHRRPQPPYQAGPEAAKAGANTR